MIRMYGGVIPGPLHEKKKKKGIVMYTYVKIQRDCSSQSPHCFTVMLKTYNCGGKLGCTGCRGPGEQNKIQQNLKNKRQHNINIPRQNFLKESNNIPPNCRPVEKLNPPEHSFFPLCPAWVLTIQQAGHELPYPQ